MIKRLSIVFLFVSMLCIQDAIAQVKIGYTNPARVLSQLPEVQEVDRQIDSLITVRDEELAAKATDLQQVFSTYESDMNNLTEQERASREEELMQLNQQFEQEREGVLQEIQLKRNELMTPIIEQMNAAIKQTADEMGLDLVLNEGTSNGDAIIFFANSDKLDITEQIIEKLKS